MKIITRIGIWRWIFTTFFLLSVSISTCYAEVTETVTVTFYHTSDLHENSENLPQIARLIRDQKEKDSNVLFLDCGDRFNKGDLTPLKTRGEAMSAIIQGMLYDAVIPGNHDFTFGSKRLLELVDKYSLPLLCANCVWAGNMKPKNVPPYKIFVLDGVTVAIIGTAASIVHFAPTGYVGKDVDGLLEVRTTTSGIVESIKSMVIELEEKADIIVLMTHLGSKADRELARALPRIDLIAGGHMHEIFYTLVFDEQTQTVIQHSGSHGMAVGEIILTWDGEKIVDRKARVIKITPDMPKSTELEAMRKSYLSKMSGK
jgi:2',3'-cyclic-nucleotide 2'-phosphodiesterase (5'-nucleotidase family)